MESLAPGPGDVVVDCTLGRGGHAIELGRRIGPDGLIVGFDRIGQPLLRPKPP